MPWLLYTNFTRTELSQKVQSYRAGASKDITFEKKLNFLPKLRKFHVLVFFKFVFEPFWKRFSDEIKTVSILSELLTPVSTNRMHRGLSTRPILYFLHYQTPCLYI